MKNSVSFILFAVIISMTTLSGSAHAQEMVGSKVQVAVTEVMTSSQENIELLMDAQDETSAFSFSDGALRGRKFMKALSLIRTEKPELRASDMEIAIAILQVN